MSAGPPARRRCARAVALPRPPDVLAGDVTRHRRTPTIHQNEPSWLGEDHTAPKNHQNRHRRSRAAVVPASRPDTRAPRSPAPDERGPAANALAARLIDEGLRSEGPSARSTSATPRRRAACWDAPRYLAGDRDASQPRGAVEADRGVPRPAGGQGPRRRSATTPTSPTRSTRSPARRTSIIKTSS